MWAHLHLNTCFPPLPFPLFTEVYLHISAFSHDLQDNVEVIRWYVSQRCFRPLSFPVLKDWNQRWSLASSLGLSVGTVEECLPSCQNGKLSRDVDCSCTSLLLLESRYNVQLCNQALNELHLILYEVISYCEPCVHSLPFSTWFYLCILGYRYGTHRADIFCT